VNIFFDLAQNRVRVRVLALVAGGLTPKTPAIILAMVAYDVDKQLLVVSLATAPCAMTKLC
jgi:hypothetical protein